MQAPTIQPMGQASTAQIMKKGGICPKCQSTEISKEKLGLMYNPLAKIIQYPGLGESFTCSGCGYNETFTLGAPTQMQMRIRTWIMALIPFACFMSYLYM